MDVSRPPFPSLPPGILASLCRSFFVDPPAPSFTRSFPCALLTSTAPLLPSASLYPRSTLSPPPSVTHCYGYVPRYPSHPHLYSIIYKPPRRRRPPETPCRSAYQVIRPQRFSSWIAARSRHIEASALFWVGTVSRGICLEVHCGGLWVGQRLRV